MRSTVNRSELLDSFTISSHCNFRALKLCPAVANHRSLINAFAPTALIRDAIASTP